MPANPKPSQKAKLQATAKPARAPKPKSAPRKPKGHGAVAEQERASIAARKAPKADGGQTKGAMIQVMLAKPGGATSKEMEAATGWKPHSVRGYLGTLRAAGVKVISKKLPKEPTIYRIEAAESAGEVL